MIEPGKGTANYKIGMTLAELELPSEDVLDIEDRDVFNIHKTATIWFFMVKSTGKLGQLTLFSPFAEKVLNKVGIGDSLESVHDNLGKCVVNHKVHESLKYPGIGFETESGGKSKSAIIDAISVTDPFAFYGEVPKHIKDNLPGKKRKLP